MKTYIQNQTKPVRDGISSGNQDIISGTSAFIPMSSLTPGPPQFEEFQI